MKLDTREFFSLNATKGGCKSAQKQSKRGENIVKYYSYVNLDGTPLFDVVWGEPLKEDDTLAVFRRGAKWSILDIESGLTLVNGVKSKKAALDWYYHHRNECSLCMRLETARNTESVKEKVKLMQEHRILHVGDRCTYIDVKDSVILNLIEYDTCIDKWLVEDDWDKSYASPDRLIKVSEVD